MAMSRPLGRASAGKAGQACLSKQEGNRRRLALPCPALPCLLALPCPALPCPALPCPALLCSVPPAMPHPPPGRRRRRRRPPHLPCPALPTACPAACPAHPCPALPCLPCPSEGRWGGRRRRRRRRRRPSGWMGQGRGDQGGTPCPALPHPAPCLRTLPCLLRKIQSPCPALPRPALPSPTSRLFDDDERVRRAPR